MTNSFKEEFKDQEYRYAYAESFLNSSIATQIAIIREQRNMTQGQLADLVGTKQTGISRIENANYSGWSIKMLKKIAKALGCRLKVSFETFGTLLEEDKNFSDESLKRPKFEDDWVFFPMVQQVPDKPRPFSAKWLELMRTTSVTGAELSALVEIASPQPKPSSLGSMFPQGMTKIYKIYRQEHTLTNQDTPPPKVSPPTSPPTTSAGSGSLPNPADFTAH